MDLLNHSISTVPSIKTENLLETSTKCVIVSCTCLYVHVCTFIFATAVTAKVEATLVAQSEIVDKTGYVACQIYTCNSLYSLNA